MVYARVWPDQKAYLEANPGLGGVLLRAAIDAQRGTKSPYTSPKAGRYSEAEAALNVRQSLEERAKERSEELKALREAFRLYVDRARPLRMHARSWLDGRRIDYRTLRYDSPDELLQELGWESMEGR